MCYDIVQQSFERDGFDENNHAKFKMHELVVCTCANLNLALYTAQRVLPKRINLEESDCEYLTLTFVRERG